MDNFNDFIKLHAICKYFESFGYEANVDENTMTVEVYTPENELLIFNKWDAAREFIKVRSQA